MTSITPFLWFEQGAEEAMALYARVFDDSATVSVSSSGEPGGFFMGTLRIANLEITIFNGGPHQAFNDAISLFVSVETQEEVDHLWNSLSEGGVPGRCGWLKDPFGVSWQIVPTALGRLMGDPDPARSSRVRKAMMGMEKFVIADLEAAWSGPSA